MVGKKNLGHNGPLIHFHTSDRGGGRGNQSFFHLAVKAGFQQGGIQQWPNGAVPVKMADTAPWIRGGRNN